MNMTITDLEASTSLEAQAMSALSGGCCYHPPVCCHYRPPCNWWGGCYKPYFIKRKVRFGRKLGQRRFNVKRRIKA